MGLNHVVSKPALYHIAPTSKVHPCGYTDNTFVICLKNCDSLLDRDHVTREQFYVYLSEILQNN